MANIEKLPQFIMAALMCALILGAVVLPVLGSIPQVAESKPNAAIINMMMGIIPVILVVVVIIAIMYIVIDRRSD